LYVRMRSLRSTVRTWDRRAHREPLQHIVGSTPFRRIDLAVGPGVFVPRPETELVAQSALDELHHLDADDTLVVDLCSGSGALALSIAVECPSVHVHAVELSDDAVLWLRRNVEELQLRDRVAVHHADAASAPEGFDGLVDVLVCNPPYIPTGATIRDREAAEHDPPLALWGGQDGLDVVRSVIANAERLLRPGGLLLIEHADVQGETLPALLAARLADGRQCWTEVADHRDLNDLPRFTSARRTQHHAHDVEVSHA
jgi:release factor glutamine methyltransferase